MTPVDATILAVLSIVIAAIGRWNNASFKGLRKRIENLEQDVTDCHSQRLLDAVTIGELKMTIKGLEGEINDLQNRLEKYDHKQRDST